MSDMLPVTQADRDAVKAFHNAMLDKLMVAVKDKKAGARFGEDEGDGGNLIQAFARHRLTTEAAQSSRIRELTEALEVQTKLADFGALIFSTLWDAFTDGQWEIEVNDLVTICATKAGLVTSTDFDPEVHDNPDGACMPGDDFYVIADAGREALRRARATLANKEQAS
jgi:hypothetical protein